jgi:lysophospholipase L1-like esterase
MRISKKFKSLLLVGVLLAALPATTLAKGPEKKVIDYVALGDSLAAGVTPYKAKDLGYPDYIAKRFEQSQYTVDFDNFAFGGFKTGDVLNQVLSNGVVREGIKEAEFITIDIGGNDLLPVVQASLANPANPANSLNIRNVIILTANNINAILMTIDGINPNAKVYVMGYFNVLPYLPENLQQALLPILDVFNSSIENTAIANGDTFVPTAKIIAKDYQTYLPNPNDIHLSLEGYQIVAKEFWKYIDKSKNNF